MIADAGRHASLQTKLIERRVTRLSQELTPGGALHPEAKERTFKALEFFGDLVKKHGVEKVFGGATAAVRLAGDGEEFLSEVNRRTGLAIRKLSGEDEARLTALGVAAGLAGVNGPVSSPVLAVDPGGQSTEFVPILKGRPQAGLSLNLGVVALTERFIRSDPPAPKELAELRAAVDRRLSEATAFFPPPSGLTLAGTAGTVTTIAAMTLELEDYDPARISGLTLTLDQVAGLIERIEVLPVAERRGIPGLEPGREDVILAGLILVERLLRVYGLNKMLVIDAGLLEGLIIDGLGLAPSG